MDESGIIQLTIIIILILLSAFFSSAETALTIISEVKVRALVDENRRGAHTLEKIASNYGKMLSTILIGNNVVNIAASSLVTTLTIKLWGSYAIGIATGVLTLVILLVGEIVPKNVAKVLGEKISLFYAPVIYGIMCVLTPIIWIVDRIARILMWLIHIDPNARNGITEAELRTYVEVGVEDGAIESEEKVIINNVFDFSDSVAREIMIPNVDMVCLEENADYDEVLARFREHMYTRLPVYKGDTDNIVGLVNIKDFILVEDRESFRIDDIIREGYYTHEYKKTSDLLREMRSTANSVAFVLSEYGECVGMITLEDLLEEIVGEIRDEFDEEENDFIKQLDDRTYVIEGSRKLDDINDAIETELDSEAYDSIAGLVIEELDRLPEEDDEVILEDGTRIHVVDVENNRITKVKLTLPDSSTLADDLSEAGPHEDNQLAGDS